MPAPLLDWAFWFTASKAKGGAMGEVPSPLSLARLARVVGPAKRVNHLSTSDQSRRAFFTTSGVITPPLSAMARAVT